MTLDAWIAPLAVLAGLLLGAAWELEQRAPGAPGAPRRRRTEAR